MAKALICETKPEIQKFVSSVLQSFNFEILTASNINEALLHIDIESPSVIFVNEAFENSAQNGIKGNKLIQHIINLPIYRRRDIFLIVLVQNIKTSSRLRAFLDEIDLYININDLNFLPSVFKKHYFEYLAKYREFKELFTK